MMMKKLLTLLSIIGISVSAYAIKPSSERRAFEPINYQQKIDSLNFDTAFIIKKNQSNEDPNKKRFKIAANFAVAFGIMTILGIALAFLGGLSLTTATIVGVYLILAGIPLGFLSMLFVWLFKRKIELTEKEKKLWKAALIFNAISVLILLGINLIP